MKKMDLEDTIVAISTPPGEGGIGIVRLSGRDSLKVADKIFVSKNGSKPSKYATYSTHYGHVVDRSASCVVRSASKRVRSTQYAVRSTQYEIIDEVILTVMRAPKSYTKEDVVEINCHGGIVPLKKVLELSLRLGARLAEPGEFTKRAFLNGRIDLSQAEAVLDVIRSKTDASLEAAVSQLEGGLSREVKNIRNNIMDFYAHIEAAIDFPEDDLRIFDSVELTAKIEAVSRRLERLLETSEKGKILREGISAVICGKTNVGKSALMNALLGEKRVIVTPIPGTTRDVIEEIVNMNGIPLKIADTAGMMEPSNIIDTLGIEKTGETIRKADLILFMLDNNQEFCDKDEAILDMVEDKKSIIIINKIDLPKKLSLDKIRKRIEAKKIVSISAVNKTNLDILEREILEMIWNGDIAAGHEALITNIRHAAALERALQGLNAAKESLEKRLSPELIAIDVKDALSALGEITGETISGDILDKIFEEFCIGK